MTLCFLSSALITAIYSLKISRGKGRTRAGHFCAFPNSWWNYFPGRFIEGKRAGKTKAHHADGNHLPKLQASRLPTM
jgi:hypothetical protein